MANPIKVGFLFAEEDAKLVDELRKQCIGMKRQGQIEMVGLPGSEHLLDQADISSLGIILLIFSKEFIADDFLVEMAMYARKQAERAGNDPRRLCVIPILAKEVNLANDLPKIGSLVCLPRNGKPVSKQNIDEATCDIAKEIRAVVTRMLGPA